MKASMGNARFASLFKKYRLRSEISTLSEFGDLLAQEGLVYETSLFTRWQNGERVPKGRRTILAILKIFYKNKGIRTVDEGNFLLESAGQGYFTSDEKEVVSKFISFPTVNHNLVGLGELLKRYRLQKNISQIELALSLGWKDTTRIIEIEQGIDESPSRELIDEISKVLQLIEQEKNSLLLAGNYLPTNAEIKHIREIVEKTMEEWPYPVVLYDFCWRIIKLNSKTIRFLKFTEEDVVQIYKTTPSAIEIIFDPCYIQNQYLNENESVIWHKNLLRFLIHFRMLHKNILKDEWYKNLIEKMLHNELFRKLWVKSNTPTGELVTTRTGKKVFVNPHNTNERLYFNIFAVPLLVDPRFELEFFTPDSKETSDFFSKLG